jgi:iron-sulfur cluster assembly protein
MLTLTANARTAIEVLTAPTSGAPPGTGVRIAATQDTNSSAGTALTMTITPTPEPDDQVMTDAGARVFLDSAAAQLLDEQTLDAELDDAKGGVSFFVRGGT